MTLPRKSSREHLNVIEIVDLVLVHVKDEEEHEKQQVTFFFTFLLCHSIQYPLSNVLYIASSTESH